MPWFEPSLRVRRLRIEDGDADTPTGTPANPDVGIEGVRGKPMTMLRGQLLVEGKIFK